MLEVKKTQHIWVVTGTDMAYNQYLPLLSLFETTGNLDWMLS